MAAGMAVALQLAMDRLSAHGGCDPLADHRDQLLEQLLDLPGLRLSGPDPRRAEARLPHHLSLLVNLAEGQPASGRSLVRALWQEGVAASSGSACSSGAAARAGAVAPSPVLQALGHDAAVAASGLRLSLGPWLSMQDLDAVPAAVERALQRLRDEGSP